jgi:TolB-like protein/tRNA A-37 threonylcarbamoyl transferase component Bud32
MTATSKACPSCNTPLPAEAKFCLNCGTATPTEMGQEPSAAPLNDAQFQRLRAALADRYRIEHVIGQGGMATVYLADDLRHQRKVAVKVLRPELAAALGPERFLREIRIAAQLQHPHILPLHDSGEADGFLFYVMPYVEGDSLRQKLEREGKLPVGEAVSIMHDVADALAHAHRRGVVHRDIKPDNVMLSDRHALVTDFGVAKAVSEATGRRDLTTAGVALGTPAYMAPEQAAADPQVDHRADIYAVGIVAYEMLTGRFPFEHETPQQLLAARVTQEPVPVLDVRPAIPTGVAQVVMRCLAREVAERWQTADELVQALEAGTTGPSVRSDVGSRVRIASRPRHPWRVAMAAAGAVAIGVTAWLLVPRGRDTPVAEALDPARIAVLYFDDRSPEQNMGYLADGLTESLIQELSRVEALRVISRNGVRPYRGGAVTLDSIVRALEVGTIVEGSVARSGDVIRVTVDLVDAESEEHLESRTLEQPWEELFALQDTLSAEVSRFLRTRLGREIRLRQQLAETQSVAAWELVQRAEGLRKEADSLARAGDSVAAGRALIVADSLLLQGQRLDRDWVVPTLVRAWVAADRADVSGVLRYESDVSWNRVALDLASDVLQRRPDYPAALELKGIVEWRLAQMADAADTAEAVDADAMQRAAEQDLRAAVTQEPQRAAAWGALSDLLRRDARFEEARRAALQALEADQFLEEARDVTFQLYETALELKEFDEAERWCSEGRRRFNTSDFSICHLFLIALPKAPRGTPEDGWQTLDRIVALSSAQSVEVNRVVGQAWQSAVLARAGLADSARAVLDRARAAAADNVKPWIDYYGANTLLHLDDRSGALELLRRFLAANPGRKRYLASDWMVESLWDDPEFKALVDTSAS